MIFTTLHSAFDWVRNAPSTKNEDERRIPWKTGSVASLSNRIGGSIETNVVGPGESLSLTRYAKKSCCIHARKLCSSEYIYTADTIFRHVFYNTVRVHVAHRIPFTFYNSVSFFYRRDPLSPIFWIDCDRYRVCAVRSLFLATTL